MKKIAWTRRGAHLVSQPCCLTQFLSLSGARWWPLDPPVHDLGYRTSRRTAVTFSTKWGRLSRVFPASARAYTLWANCYDGQDERTRRGANSMEALSEIVSFLKDEETKLDSLGGVVQFADRALVNGHPLVALSWGALRFYKDLVKKTLKRQFVSFYAFYYTFSGTKLHQDVLTAYFNLMFTYWQVERLIVQIMQFKWSTISVM